MKENTADATMTKSAEAAATNDAMATAYDAGAVRVPPWMAVTAALASVRPDGIGSTIDWLVAHRDELERAYSAGRDATLGVAVLPPEMQYVPELGFLDRPRDDNALREKYLFADCVGKLGFFQTAVYAMTGIELSARDAEMLDQIGNANILVDRRAWPMAVTRRVAARGGGYGSAVVAGIAMMGSPVLAGAAAADCARFLLRARAAEVEGRDVEALVRDVIARGERIMGFGRPAVGPDERVPVMNGVLREYGRYELPYVRVLRRVEKALSECKALLPNAAAVASAILLDFGMSPEGVHAVCNHWVAVAVYAQAVFSGEQALKARR